MKTQLIEKSARFLGKTSSGSAIAEFLIFTLPFFSLLLLITMNLYQHSIATNEAKNLARQSLRAFISSPSFQLSDTRGRQVVQTYEESLSDQDRDRRKFEIEFKCSNNPCLTPGGSVTAFLTVSIEGQGRGKIIGSATEYVDLWR